MLAPGPGRQFGLRTRLRSSSIDNCAFITSPPTPSARKKFRNSTRFQGLMRSGYRLLSLFCNNSALFKLVNEAPSRMVLAETVPLWRKRWEGDKCNAIMHTAVACLTPDCASQSCRTDRPCTQVRYAWWRLRVGGGHIRSTSGKLRTTSRKLASVIRR